jgi:hypothetical protein
MSTPRELLAEADRLRSLSVRAQKLSATLAVNGGCGSIQIAHSILYIHEGYPGDLMLISVWRDALDRLAYDLAEQADVAEARVGVTS